MNNIIQSILSYFIEKGGEFFFKQGNDAITKKKIKKIIEAFTIRYFEQNFYQIPLTQEFDFEGLNTYLYENIDSIIAPCFNAPSHKEREFFKEKLISDVFRASKADSREKKNTVKAYVQCIIAIIENQFIERIDDKDWFLSGRVVDEVRTITSNLIKEYSIQIDNYLRYYGSFAENIDSILIHYDTNNQYHYLNKNIVFKGRETDLEYLDRFLAAPDSLLFAVITGQGGIGKSKLLHYYQFRETGNLEWKIVFPTKQQIKLFANSYAEWYYPKNLLVIIDYAGESPEVIGEWIDLLNNSRKRPHKIRLVMLERQGVVKGDNETNIYPNWYMKIKQAAGHNFDNLLFEKQFHYLEPLKQDEFHSLMDNVAQNQGKNVSLRDKKSIIIHARNMGKETDRFLTPLMIILLTDAFLNGEVLGNINTQNLMQYIIKKHRQYWLNTTCNGDENIFNSLELHLVYATATGGWDLNPLPHPFTETSTNFLNKYNYTDLGLVLSSLMENTCHQSVLMPIEPDIIGEYYVLWFLSEYRLKTNYNKLLKLLWGTSIRFAYFLDRCIHSFLCDNQFSCLVDGKHSIFIDNMEISIMYLQSILLVVLAAWVSCEQCQNVVKRLQALAQDDRYSGSKGIVLAYAKSLVILSSKQDAAARVDTITQLQMLAQDDRYSGNQDIAFEFAKGLVNLLNKQDAATGADTIAQLEVLAQDDRYSDNQDIVLAYATGLGKLSSMQDTAAGADTIVYLQALAQDDRYSGNQGIVLAYAKSLVNLSSKQDAASRVDTVTRLQVLAQDDRYSGNQEIVLMYAKGLCNLSSVQDAVAMVDTIARLQVLAQDDRYSDNQGIVLVYAMGLFNLSSEQDVVAMVDTIAQLQTLAQDDRYSDNQNIVLVYAKGLFMLLSEQDVASGADTIARLQALIQDDRYSDNQDIALVYAKGMANLLCKQDIASGADTVVNLQALAQDDRYSDNQDIVFAYAQGLVNRGFTLYEMEAFNAAGEAFLRSFRLGHQDGGINLAYMARRGEYDLNDISIEDLLEKSIKSSSGLAITNYALYKAINNKDWVGSDVIFEEMSINMVNEIFSWWETLFTSGDLEGMLVMIWLERHGKIELNLLKTPNKYYKLLRSKFDVPSWIIRREQ